VTRYTVTSANDATIYPDRNPANWRFLGSTNAGQSWVTLDTRINQTFTDNFQKLTYNFSNSATYNIYRVQIDRVANPQVAVAVQLSELQFLDVPPGYSYLWLFGDGTSSIVQNPLHSYSSNGVYASTLVVSDGLTSVTNSVIVTVASPALSISQPSQSKVTIAWPSWASGYSLHLATNLASPIDWSVVTNQPSISSNQLVLTLPIDPNLNHFFRLSSP
jgi:PKD repeat protein